MAASAATLAATLFVGSTWWEYRRDRRALVAIQTDLENNLYGTAARKLTVLVERRPGWDEARYLLATTEAARGRTIAAAEVYKSIPSQSAFAPRAMLGMIALELEQGRYANAEEIVLSALKEPGVDGSSLPILLGPIYCQQGRLDETLDQLEARWRGLDGQGQGASEAAINLVRAHVALRLTPVPIDAIRQALDHAGILAPSDDRVWLGKANLAIQTGATEEAASWLDRCQVRRPDDRAVWRARLNWAVAANRIADARIALERMPPGHLPPAEAHRLAAWFARGEGKIDAERRALEQLIAARPSEFAAIDQLIKIETKAGRTDRVTELRRLESETQRQAARYQRLLERHQPRRDAAEMAHLAEKLGQPFEAWAWAKLAAATDPDRADYRETLARLTKSGETQIRVNEPVPRADRRQRQLASPTQATND
jgi:thioredoxin-like negative regulator of GroEL